MKEWKTGEHTYEYYDDGSLHYQKDGSGNVQQTHSYTFDGLLSSVAHAGAGTSSMTWDGDQNRISFTSSTGGTTTFVYDVTAGIPAVIAEVTTGGTVYYVREPDGALLARISGETTQYYHFNDLGSTVFITGSSGTVTDTYAYDAWGNVTNHTGSTNQPYQYVGQLGYYTHYQDENMSGLLQLGVRFYAPEIGRFTQRDPLLSFGWSAYSYGNDNSLVRIDPSGRKSKIIIDKGETDLCISKFPSRKKTERYTCKEQYWDVDWAKVRRCLKTFVCSSGPDLTALILKCRAAAGGGPYAISQGQRT